MDTILTKLRDLLSDNYKFINEAQEYYGGAKIFPLQYANIDSTTLVTYKNGVVWLITPVAGSGVAWTRTGTTITITKTGHGLITGDSVTITVSSDATALPLGAKTVTKLTDNTFTVVGLNAGAASGTCTYTIIANYSYSSTTGKITITGTFTAGDVLTFEYNAYEKYSTSELRAYIRNSLYYLAIEKYKVYTARVDNLIFPTPTEEEEALIAIIAAILIKGNIRQYRTPEFTIIFDTDNMSIDKKIKETLFQFKKAFGVLDYIDLKAEEEHIEPTEN
jgi:hypothetical protein